MSKLNDFRLQTREWLNDNARLQVMTTHTVTIEGIQMHGGIGMTDEYEIGFFLKRSKIPETLYGDRYFHLDRFATLRGY